MSDLVYNGLDNGQGKQIGGFPIARISALFLILFITALNLFTYHSTVKTIILEGIHYRGFESWNFIFELFYVPFTAVLYFIAIIFIVYAIRKESKRKQTLLLPVYFILLKSILLFFFRPGLADAEKFNYAILRDYAIDCIVFLLAIFGLFFQLYKIREFNPSFQYREGRRLTTLNLLGAADKNDRRTD